MEKTKHSVVKHLIAVAVALLLFGSSGGVAWGQTPTIYPYGSLNTPNDMCWGTYQSIGSSISLDNNYGPGEGRAGQITVINPTTTPLSYGTSGKITVGGTENVVRHKNIHHPNPIIGRTTIPATMKKKYVYHGGGTWQCDDDYMIPGNYQEILTPPAPSVPDGSGRTEANPSYGEETYVEVDGTTKSSSSPWVLQQFYFRSNPWYYYDYVGVNSGNECWNNRWSEPNCGSGGGALNTIYYTMTRSANPGGYVDGRIILRAGSHVQLEGGSAPSANGKTVGIGAENITTTTKTHLVLPSSHYTLMIDNWFDEASISAHGWTDLGSGNGSGASDVLGVNAVLGIKEGYNGKNFKTNAVGGTILIGGAKPFPGQGNMEIVASSGNAGGSFGFSGSGQVYTGTCVPTAGTANLGNYDANDVYVTDVTLPSSLADGGLQIFNTKENLFMEKAYPITQNGAGHLLMMANKTLNINKKQTLVASNNGNTNLMGGDVIFGSDAVESFNGSGSGAYPEKSTYSVVAFGTGNNTPTISAPLPLGEVNTCNLGYSWCGNETNLIGTAMPTNNTPAAARFQPFATGVTYGGSCHTSFSGNGNIEYNSTGTGSTVTLSNKHNAQWQAKNDIKITPTGTSFGWSNTGGGFMQWVAGHNINLANQTTANWTASGSDAAVFWRTGSDILLGDQVTAN